MTGIQQVETSRMQAAIENRRWDIVISDYVLPRFSGLAALDVLKAAGLDLPFIIVSGRWREYRGPCDHAGAHDYIMKRI
jgi:CheY-like chemotaxis protein